jgi:hypothetical protein
MFRWATLVAAVALLLVPATTGAGGPGRWTRIQSGNANDATPGLARTGDGTLHVAWVRGGGASADVVQQAISADGALSGQPTVIAANWQVVNPDAELVRVSGGLRAVWAGVRAGVSGGQVVASSSTDGSSWSAPAAITNAPSGVSAAGIGAAAGPGGVVAAAQGDVAPGMNVVHVGSGPDTRYETGCCAFDPEVAVDAVTGKFFVGWFSTVPGRQGLWTQEVSTAGLLGPAAHAPGSSSTDSSAAVRPGQRTSLTGRIGAGGVYLAYGAGYPALGTVQLKRIGRQPVAVARSARIEHVGIAAGPGGRLWLFWSTGDGYAVTRSNTAATRFESVTRVPLPEASATTYGLYGEGSAGTLDLVAHAGSASSIPDWHTQVLPRLSLTVVFSRTEKKGGQLLRRLSLRVTDAGDPVAGATVKLAGRTLHTVAGGRASGLFPSTGRQAGAKATKAGYAAATTRVRL